MNEKVEITITLDNVVILDKIFFIKPGNSSEFLVSDIMRYIKYIKIGRVEKGSLEK